jgi:exodeoxyribonuclease I
MPFVFYDTETTGSLPFYDQIVQFAAIRTDDALEITGQFDIRCRLTAASVPTPGALSVTRTTIAELTDPRLPSHYDMVRAVRAQLAAWSPAIFVGYNSFEFDEHLLRQSFWQTLHSPWLTSSGGNGRLDMLQLALAINLFEPNALDFPRRPDGKPSFRLDALAPANGFAPGQAHNAMADSAATLHLARLVRQRAPDFWSHAVRMSNRQAAESEALAQPLCLYTEFHYNRPHHWLLAPLGSVLGNNGQFHGFDLAFDPGTFAVLDDPALARRVSSAPKPLRRVRTRACPLILPWQRARDICPTAALGAHELLRRARILQDDESLRHRLLEAHAATWKGYPPSPYLEEQIYDAFASPEDEARMEHFHGVDWPQRPSLVPAFDDPRLRQLALRLICLEHPEVLDEPSRPSCERAIATRLTPHQKVPWTTLPMALEELDRILEVAAPTDRPRLEALGDHLAARLSWARAVLAGP